MPTLLQVVAQVFSSRKENRNSPSLKPEAEANLALARAFKFQVHAAVSDGSELNADHSAGNFHLRLIVNNQAEVLPCTLRGSVSQASIKTSVRHVLGCIRCQLFASKNTLHDHLWQSTICPTA